MGIIKRLDSEDDGKRPEVMTFANNQEAVTNVGSGAEDVEVSSNDENSFAFSMQRDEAYVSIKKEHCEAGSQDYLGTICCCSHAHSQLL